MLKKIISEISRVEGALVTALLGFNVLILFYGVVLRYVFNNAPAWPEEMSRYVMIWIVYLGASISIEQKSEINIDVLTTLSKSKHLKTGLSLFAKFAGLAVSIFILVYGVQFIEVVEDAGMIAASFPAPMYLICLIIPLSGFLMALKYIATLSATIMDITRPSKK